MAHAEVNPGTVHRVTVRLMQPYLLLLGNRIAVNASERCNVDQGTLRSSIHVIPREMGFRVGSPLPYALFVHEGTRPHKIYPRKPGGWLRFPTAGGIRFARSVNHPGYRGNPFLRDAADEEIGRL